jgi:hypothetical protein
LDLLVEARALLNGSSDGVRSLDRSRAASFVARAALEGLIEAELNERNYAPGDASVRTRLTCLEAALRSDPARVARFQYAWSRLSAACHHHAFDLSPSASEVCQLIEAVEGLCEAQAADLAAGS